jgi:hypothetical protein
MDTDREALENQCQELKITLKKWENQFRTDNGRKPTRDEIKANAIGAYTREAHGDSADQLNSSKIQGIPKDTRHTVRQSHDQRRLKETKTLAFGP